MHTSEQHAGLPTKGHVMAFLMLGLFWISYNINSVFYQVRRADPADLILSYTGYLSGMLLFGLAMPALERLAARPGKPLSPPRLFVLLLLLLPPAVCLVSPLATAGGYAGNRFLNTFQPMLWGMYMPLVFRLFFLHCAAPLQALYYFICVGTGHLCWALLMPFVSGPDATLLTQFNAVVNRFLPFLNATRCALSALVALLAFRLMTLPETPAGKDAPDDPAGCPAPTGATETGLVEAGRVPALFPALVFLLTPLVLCFTVNGVFSFQFFVRLSARGPLMEYMHLALALFFPFLGVLLPRAGERLLLYGIMAGVLFFALAPLFPWLEAGSGGQRLLIVLFSTGNQLLAGIGTLILSRYARNTAFPALVVSCAWLSAMVSLPAGVLTRVLFTNAPGAYYYATLYVLAALCVPSAFLLRRAFPLPPLPAAARAGQAVPPGNTDEARGKFRAFVEAFDLTRREAEILGAIIAGRETADIGEALGISERTARHHLTGVLRKTKNPSRQRLEVFFAKWHPE